MTYKLRAGAPFDLNNTFNVPALDPGFIVNPYPTAILAVVDGGTFITPSKITYDGGLIPAAGTASYNPNKVYNSLDIVSN
jgi:hypothetical protein